MSVTVTTGAGSLISVGLAVTDVANLFAVGRRVGNWATALTGDAEFLDLLQSDELDLLRRRGMIDVVRFNAQWGQRARLLMNGRPTDLVGDDAAKVLGTLSRFTCSMVAIVAALDGFMNYTVLKDVMKRLLKELVRTTEYGEDVLSSQLNDRLNAWRSTSYLRGLSIAVQNFREDLIADQKALPGYMPAGEAQVMAEFLFWLLACTTDILTTPSSDVAAVAVVLSKVGFDLLSVDGWGVHGRDTTCKVVYKPVFISTEQRYVKGYDFKNFDTWFEDTASFWREQSTAVSLTQPEESMSVFPISKTASNEVRQAWLEGTRAASSACWRVNTAAAMSAHAEDIVYEAIDLGTSPGRIRDEIFALAKCHGFCINAEYCEGLSNVFERTDVSILVWLHEQSRAREYAYRNGQHITSAEMLDKSRIHAFTIYQAFMFGYYYAVFLPFVDTSTLAIQTVSGAWGYRSAEALDVIREYAILKILTREGMQIILAALCFSQVKTIPDLGLQNRCLGIIGKRALLVNSLVAESDFPQAVGRFTMLDVAVGHIPCDVDGLVRPGAATLFCEEFEIIDPSIRIPQTIVPATPDEDFTKHIEPDWDGNPETVLLVMRYKGRRVATLNPAFADVSMCRTYIDPVEEPAPEQKVPRAIEFTIEDFLARKCLYTKSLDGVKIVVQSIDKPGIRYTAAVAYMRAPWKVERGSGKRHPNALVSNCVVAATMEDVHVIVT